MGNPYDGVCIVERGNGCNGVFASPLFIMGADVVFVVDAQFLKIIWGKKCLPWARKMDQIYTYK